VAVAWALGVWATNSWVGMNGGPPNAWRGESTPPPATVLPPGGGDSTRLRNKGRRPKYFWEAAREKSAAEVAEAAFDAVASAYTETSNRKLDSQIRYLRSVEVAVQEARRFGDLAHQIHISIEDLEQRLALRRQQALEEEENEVNELLELL